MLWNIVYQCTALGCLIQVACQTPHNGQVKYSYSYETVNNNWTSSKRFRRLGSEISMNPSRSNYLGQSGYSGQPTYSGQSTYSGQHTYPDQSNSPGQSKYLSGTDYGRSYILDFESTTDRIRMNNSWLGLRRIISKTGCGQDIGRYEVVVSTISIIQRNSYSGSYSNPLGDRGDFTGLHDLDTLHLRVPMHPLTLEVWRTRVLGTIYNFVSTKRKPCEVVVSILYETKNDTRPYGFYVVADTGGKSIQAGDISFYVFKGYVPNPSTKIDMSYMVHVTASFALCIIAVDNPFGRSCVSPANPSDGTPNGRSVGRYELLEVFLLRGTKKIDQSSPSPILNAFNALEYDDRHEKLRGTRRPAMNFLNDTNFLKMWKSQVIIPLSKCLTDNNRQMGATLSVSLIPTYIDNRMATPQGFFIAVHDGSTGALLLHTYFPYGSSFLEYVGFVPSQESNTERQKYTESTSEGSEKTPVQTTEANQVALSRIQVFGTTRYELMSGIVSMENTFEEDLDSSKSKTEKEFAKNLGDADDVAGFLLGRLTNFSVIVPMHPFTLEVWKTKVENQIYDYINSTGKRCEITVIILYDTKNDTRPNGFYVLANDLTLEESEIRKNSTVTAASFQYVLKGYVPNPSTKLNKNMFIKEALSSPRGTEVAIRRYGIQRSLVFCVSLIEQNNKTVADKYLSRYESLTVKTLVNPRWSKMSETEGQPISTPASLKYFEDEQLRYDIGGMLQGEMKDMKKPDDLILNSTEFAEIWRTHVETPLLKSFGVNRRNGTKFKAATITLHPTYDGTSVTPSGFFITGHPVRTPFDIQMKTYIPLPITPPSWLATVTTERPPDVPLTSCPLPPKPEGSSYKIGDCETNQIDGICEKQPGSWVVEYTMIVYDCEEGYVHPMIDDVERTYALCLDGKWKPPSSQCQKKCGPLISASHDIECEYYGKPVSCSYNVPPGTIARPKCKPHLHFSEPVEYYPTNKCKEDGDWQYKLFECILDCGVSNTTYRPRIANGNDVAPGEYPWVVGLFWKKNDTFEHFCGGSIINSNLILTAAHCTYDEETGKDRKPSDIMVAVGKFNRSWDIYDAYEGRMTVLEVNSSVSYGRMSKDKSYFDDIAVLQLTVPITLSEFTLPVCIDWTKRGLYSNGDTGTVVGWGKNEHGQPSDLLQSATLSYLDNNTCFGMCPGFYKKYMLPDKFCVGSGKEEGTSVQQGDSGGGFTFIRYQFHFLYGVLSTHPQFDNGFALYTDVTQKLDWIRKWAETWPAPKRN